VWTRDGTGLSQPTPAGWQKRLKGHEQLRKKLSHRAVSSCIYYLCRKGLSSFHTVRNLNVYGSGRRGWEGVRVHIGPTGLKTWTRRPHWGGMGWGGFLDVYYTNFSVRMRATINWCLKNEKCENKQMLKQRLKGPINNQSNSGLVEMHVRI